MRKAPFLCLFKYLISMFLLETCERKWPLLPQKSLCYTNHTFSVRHDLWGESIIYRSQASYKKHLPQSLRKRTEIAWCCWRPKFTTRGGWRIHSTARVGQRQDHDHGGELKDSPGKYLFPHYESNSFSQQLQMEGLPHSRLNNMHKNKCEHWPHAE